MVIDLAKFVALGATMEQGHSQGLNTLGSRTLSALKKLTKETNVSLTLPGEDIL